MAAVGSDDEDEDFGALFSQLARSILKAHILKKKKTDLQELLLFAVCANSLPIFRARTEKPTLSRFIFIPRKCSGSLLNHINLLRLPLLFTKPLVVAATTRKTQFSKITMTNDHCDTVFLFIYLDSSNNVFGKLCTVLTLFPPFLLQTTRNQPLLWAGDTVTER